MIKGSENSHCTVYRSVSEALCIFSFGDKVPRSPPPPYTAKDDPPTSISQIRDCRYTDCSARDQPQGFEQGRTSSLPTEQHSQAPMNISDDLRKAPKRCSFYQENAELPTKNTQPYLTYPQSLNRANSEN